MRKLFASLALCAVATAFGEVVNKPDENTLWQENGKNIETTWKDAKSDQHIRSSNNGTFFFECVKKGNEGHRDFRYFPFSKEYPWLVFRLASISPTQPGYQGWVMIMPNPSCRIGQTSAFETGTFAINVMDGSPFKEGHRNCEILLYNYLTKLGFTELKMVRKPDNFITATSPAFTERKSFSPGDKLTFTVTLKEPAEDVSLRVLFHDLLFSVKPNGIDKIQLKPVDDSQLVWTTELEIKSLAAVMGNKNYKRHQLLLRATVLGGSIKEPLWGTINYPYYATPQPAPVQ